MKSLIIAGATGYGAWPANTLEGAEHCLEAPIDGFEIDVVLTADGRVVAHHDYHLSADATRLDGRWLETRGPTLKSLTLAELRRYDVGALKPGSKAAARHPRVSPMAGVGIPTLTQLLDLLRSAEGARRWIYIEIKTDPTRPEIAPNAGDITGKVIDAVEAADWVDRAKVIAFDWRVLRLARDRNPDIATAHLTLPASVGIDPASWTDGCDPRDHDGSDLAAIKAHGGAEWSPHHTDISADRLDEAADLGLRVGPWGLSAGDDIRRMIEMGVFSATVSGPDWGQQRH